MEHTLTPEQIRAFVIAGHGNFETVKQMLAEFPALLNASHQWSEDDFETAIQTAAHVGNTAIAPYLLEQGAPLAICTAAMLGDRDTVLRLLADDPAQISATGAHHIPLLTHAVLSGDVELAQMVFERGAQQGATLGLSLAVNKGDVDMVRWLLKNASPDPNWTNFQGKTAHEIAQDQGFAEIVTLLDQLQP